MKSKDQRVPILLTCGLIILDMNTGNGLAISLSVYLSLSKNDMLKNKTKQNKTTQHDLKGQRDIHRAKATLNVKQKLYT